MSFIDTLMRASAARDQYDWMKPLNLTRHQERTVKRETEAMTRKRQDYAVQLTAAMIINILADKYNGNEYIPDILANLRKMCEEAGEGRINLNDILTAMRKDYDIDLR